MVKLFHGCEKSENKSVALLTTPNTLYIVIDSMKERIDCVSYVITVTRSCYSKRKISPKNNRPNTPPTGRYLRILSFISANLTFNIMTTNKKRTAIAPT